MLRTTNRRSAAPTTATPTTAAPVPPDVVRARLAPLRRHTAANHAALERAVDISDATSGPDSYRALLERFCGIYLPLEERLAVAVSHIGLPFDWEARRKSPLLTRDLRQLGCSLDWIAALPRCADLPRLETRPEVFGCLYVVEGSTLGAQVIARQLAGRPWRRSCLGEAFFTGYGAGTGEMWRQFVTHLALELSDPDAERAIHRAAAETFAAFERWFAFRNTSR